MGFILHEYRDWYNIISIHLQENRFSVVQICHTCGLTECQLSPGFYLDYHSTRTQFLFGGIKASREKSTYTKWNRIKCFEDAINLKISLSFANNLNALDLKNDGALHLSIMSALNDKEH